MQHRTLNIELKLEPESRIQESEENLRPSAQSAGKPEGGSLGLFGDDFSVAPQVNRRAVEAGGLARHQSGAAQRAPGAGQRTFVFTASRLHLWTAIVADCPRNYRTLSTRPPAVCR